MVAECTRLFCLATNVTVDAREPTLLQVFGRTIFGLVP